MARATIDDVMVRGTVKPELRSGAGSGTHIRMVHETVGERTVYEVWDTE